jgi:adenylate cyclase
LATPPADLASTRLEMLRELQRTSSLVLRAVARGASLQSVLDEVVEAATRLLDGGNGRLWLLRDGLLHVVANRGTRAGLDTEHEAPTVPTRSTMAGRTAVSRAVVHLPDVDADPDYTYAGPRPYRSGLHAPILFDDELIGVIGITREETGAFSEEDIDLLTTFADQAAIAIANARLLDAVDRQRTELSRFLSPQIAALVSSDEGERLLAGHRAYITVVFCDLRGFTSFVETAAPEELLEVLRRYHGTLGGLIPEFQGTLEHFAGDGVMVFFNDPVPVDEHELQAIRFAASARERVGELAEGWRKQGIDLGVGIGIASGHATLGRIGFEGRYDYGALGPVTNLASRLSTNARAGQILVSQRVFAAVEDRVEVAPVPDVELKGFMRPVTAFEILRLRS